MKKLFELEKIEPADLSDVRGPTYNWNHPDGTSTVIMVRKKGSSIGNHYHKGKDPSKNPERLFILSGKAKVVLVDKRNKENKEAAIVRGGQVLTIFPWISHSIGVMEDLVLVEHRLTPFDPEHPDTHRSYGKEYKF